VLEDLAIIVGFRDGSSNDEARTKKISEVINNSTLYQNTMKR
jgi:hypothetical protein